MDFSGVKFSKFFKIKCILEGIISPLTLFKMLIALNVSLTSFYRRSLANSYSPIL